MQNHVGEIAALLAALGWTISALCWTEAGKSVGSLVVNTVRLVIAFPFFLLFGFFLLGEAIPFSASGRAWILLGSSGVLGFFVCDLFLFRSFLMIGPRLAMLVFSLSPLVASLCGWIWLDERLSLKEMSGIAVALSGVIWVLLESPGLGRESGPQVHISRLGLLFAFLAMVSQGVSSVIANSGMQEMSSPVAATEIRLLGGLVCFLVLMPIVGKHKACLVVFKDSRVLTILVVGAITGPAMGVVLLMFAFKHIPTGMAMTFVSLTPVLIIPFTVVMYKERVSVRTILGTMVACAGSAMLLL